MRLVCCFKVGLCAQKSGVWIGVSIFVMKVQVPVLAPTDTVREASSTKNNDTQASESGGVGKQKIEIITRIIMLAVS